jgi:hypothetical protein
VNKYKEEAKWTENRWSFSGKNNFVLKNLADLPFKRAVHQCSDKKIKGLGRASKSVYRRKIRLIESNAKCRYLKNCPV